MKKTQRHKGKGTTRVVTREVKQDSFFSFFSPPKQPERKEGDDEDDEEEEVDEETQRKIAMDYQMGEVLKERIVPHAVMWFTGQGDDESDDDDEDYDDEDDDEDDEDDGDAVHQGRALRHVRFLRA